VRNYTARNHLNSMKLGDICLFYHSNEGLEIVGSAIVTKTAEPDLTVTPEKLTKDGKNPWVVVTVAPHETFKKTFTLQQAKQDKNLQNMALLKYGRLSVQPVTPDEYTYILEKTKA